jgi:hypothetical protein
MRQRRPQTSYRGAPFSDGREEYDSREDGKDDAIRHAIYMMTANPARCKGSQLVDIPFRCRRIQQW